MKKLMIISILFFLIAIKCTSQNIAACYDDMLKNRYDYNYFTLNENQDDIDLHIKVQSKLSFGIAQLKKNVGVLEEFAIFGPIDSLWFVIHTEGWNQKPSSELIDLRQVTYLYCYDHLFNPRYLLVSGYGHPQELIYVDIEKGIYYGFDSNVISSLPDDINNFSFSKLIKMASYDIEIASVRRISDPENIRLKSISKSLEFFNSIR